MQYFLPKAPFKENIVDGPAFENNAMESEIGFNISWFIL